MASSLSNLAKSRYTDIKDEPIGKLLTPISGYQNEPLLPLEEAVLPISHLFVNLEQYVYIAKYNCQNPEDGLTQDESAAIHIYTMQLDSGESLYTVLNRTLRKEKREILIPWFKYLRLFLTALFKLDSIPSTIWRGERDVDLSQKYKTGTKFAWWGVSSCTMTPGVFEKTNFLGKTGVRTLFSIECMNGKAIRKHSYFSDSEKEVILMPGSFFEVIGKVNPAVDLHIIHLKEIQPPFPLIKPIPVEVRKVQKESSDKIDAIGETMKQVSISGTVTTTISKNPTAAIKQLSETKTKDDNNVFACASCDIDLDGSKYVLKDEKPYCLKCYEFLFSNDCHACHLKIGTYSKDLSYKDLHYHEKCFVCAVCKVSLSDQPFGYRKDKIYCGTCMPPNTCDYCCKIFVTGTKKLSCKGQDFHETCFKCSSCSKLIGETSFIPKDDNFYCVPCYENLFAKKCSACKQVIKEGGVSWREKSFHKQCFKCSGCEISLTGKLFRSFLNDVYCSDCVRCEKCDEKLEGAGKMCSFENRRWHISCFTCDSCQTSLVGKGFIVSGLKILCPQCSKQ